MGDEVATKNLPDGWDEIEPDVSLLAADTMFGDIRDTVLEQIRTMQKPWPKMSETEQGETIDSVQRRVADAIKTAAHIMASGGRHTIAMNLAKVEFPDKKDEVRGMVTCSDYDAHINMALVAAKGTVVQLVSVEFEKYLGEQSPAEPDPDQPSLPTDDDEGEK